MDRQCAQGSISSWTGVLNVQFAPRTVHFGPRFHGAGEPIPAVLQRSSIRGRFRPSQAAACRGGAREREGGGASSVTMAWYSQSSRKLFLAKRTQDWRADRTMCAAVRIT